MRALTPIQWTAWPTPAEPWFRARPFGTAAEDLDVDFHGQARPRVLTQLLGLCLRRPDDAVFGDDELWAWTLPRRLQGLLAVMRANGIQRLDALAQCQAPACGEKMELPLDLTAFVQSEDVASFDWTSTDGETFSVAMPTGADQLHWLDLPEVSTALMAQRLVRADAVFSDAALDRLSATLEEKDPFTALQLNTQCPVCAAAIAVNFDLEAELLRRLERFQAQRLREIHLLASCYHWSETQIMALPTWRRAQYLRQVSAERSA